MQVASSVCSLTQFLPANLTALRFLGRTFATLPLGESVVLKLSIPCLLYIYLFYLIFRYDDISKSTIRIFFKMKMLNLHSPLCVFTCQHGTNARFQRDLLRSGSLPCVLHVV